MHGIRRRTSVSNTDRIDHLLFKDTQSEHQSLFLHSADLTDSSSLIHVMQQVRPDEIYNLGAQSDVKVSFEEPEYTADCDAVGTLRLLEAIRILGLGGTARFYQASTSEMFGLVQQIPQTEATPFHPRSPYAVAKLYAHWITINYRESYGIFACNGILFNHESPVRGEAFVTRKITRALANIKLGIQKELFLGNLASKRDWGHAREYVEMQWLMLQQKEPRDYLIATGEQHSVREFTTLAAKHLDIQLTWEGSGAQEKGYDQHGRQLVSVDPLYFRPAEVETLIGDPTRARLELGWEPKISFEDLVREMVIEDLKKAERDAIVRQHGVM